MDIKEINSEELEALYKQTEKGLKKQERELKKERDIWKKITLRALIESTKKQIFELLGLIEWNNKPKKDEEIIIAEIWTKEQVNIILDPLIFELLKLLSNKKLIKIDNKNDLKSFLAEQIWTSEAKINLFLIKLWITDEFLYEWITIKKTNKKEIIEEEYIEYNETESKLSKKEIQRNILLELFKDENNIDKFKWDSNQIKLAELANIEDLYSLYSILNFTTTKTGDNLQKKLWYTPIKLKTNKAKELVKQLEKYIQTNGNRIITIDEIINKLEIDKNTTLLIIRLYGIEKINLENTEKLFKKQKTTTNKEIKKRKTTKPRKTIEKKEKRVSLDSKLKTLFLKKAEKEVNQSNLNTENIEKHKWNENYFRLAIELNTSLSSLRTSLYKAWILKYLSYTGILLNTHQTKELKQAVDLLKEKPEILEEYKIDFNEEKFRTALNIHDKKIITKYILLFSGNKELIEEIKNRKKLNNNQKNTKTKQSINAKEKKVSLNSKLRTLFLINPEDWENESNLNIENIERYKWDENQLILAIELSTGFKRIYTLLYKSYIFKLLWYTSIMLNINQTKELKQAIEILKEKPETLEEYKIDFDEEKFRTALNIHDRKIVTKYILLFSGNEEVIKEIKNRKKAHNNTKPKKNIKHKQTTETKESIKPKQITEAKQIIETKQSVETKEKRVPLIKKLKEIFLIDQNKESTEDNLNIENLERYEWNENQLKLTKELNTGLASLYITLYKAWIFKYLSYTCVMLNKEQTKELRKTIEILKEKPEILEEYKIDFDEEKFRNDLNVYDRKIVTKYILLFSGNEEVIKEMKSKKPRNNIFITKENIEYIEETEQNIEEAKENLEDKEDTLEEVNLEIKLRELLLLDPEKKATLKNLNEDNIESTIDFLLSLPIKKKTIKSIKKTRNTSTYQNTIEKKEKKLSLEGEVRKIFLLDPEKDAYEDNLNLKNIELYKWDKNQLNLVLKLNTNLNSLYLLLNNIW